MFIDKEMFVTILNKVDNLGIEGTTRAWNKVVEVFEMEYNYSRSVTYYIKLAKKFNVGFIKTKPVSKIKKNDNLVQIEDSLIPVEETYKRDKEACQQLIAYVDIQMPKYNKAAKSAAKGSMKAAIKLQCLECCGYDQLEVRQCDIKHCPLWNFRPYK